MTWLAFGKLLGRHWVWLVLAAAIGAAAYYSTENAAARADLSETRDRLQAAEQSVSTWKSAYDRQVELAVETAKARAAERETIITIRDAASVAREEAARAPGADDPYRYSDGLYRFMQQRPEDAAGSPAPAAGVDRR